MTAPTITTGRLTLRPLTFADFGPYAAFLASDRSHHMHGPHDKAKAWAWFTNDIAHWPLFGYGGLAIHTPHGPVGMVAVTMGITYAEPELGWLLYERHEGQGYAAEAARALRDWVFARDAVPSLVSYVGPDNTRSRRVAERIGAVLDAEAARPDDSCLVYRHERPAA